MVIHDYNIERIEKEIIYSFHNSRDYENLLSVRRDMINHIVKANLSEFLPAIIEFNDKLTDALREMYERAHTIWDSVDGSLALYDDEELTAHCFLGHNYPALHPVQGQDRQVLWDALCNCDNNILYYNGITLKELVLPRDSGVSFQSFIGMDCPPPNWNQGLDKELTKDLHLIQQFKHLFLDMKFAITDFIYVRDFDIKINLEVNKTI